MTTFLVGDMVRADLTAQGLDRGWLYTVTEVHEDLTPFGNFVTYVVRHVGLGHVCAVSNGHMLLTKV